VPLSLESFELERSPHPLEITLEVTNSYHPRQIANGITLKLHSIQSRCSVAGHFLAGQEASDSKEFRSHLHSSFVREMFLESGCERFRNSATSANYGECRMEDTSH
jgi:hypothetical protein